MKATVICENCVFRGPPGIAEQGWDLLGEHGWAVFLETAAGNYLFDTGLGPTIINNARLLNLDLSSIKAIILSHCHHDHTGGLLPVLNEIKKKVPVSAHEDLFRGNYIKYKGKLLSMGIQYTQAQLEEKGAEFIFNKGVKEIIPGVYLTGEVPRLTSFEKGDADLLMKKGEELVPDPIMDDQSLVIKTDQGISIILGCAHAGVINIIEYAKKITGEELIHTVIGGTHLQPVSAEQRDKSIEALKTYNIARLGVSHCTGLPAFARLSQEFGDRFLSCNVGVVVEI